MTIGILGTRGIPNYYGGFEQFAEYLSVALVRRGYEVYVYNSSLHPYQSSEWNSVNIIHCKDYEDRYNTAGQFIYDLNCIKDANKRKFDIILLLGYTSSSVWGKMLDKKRTIVIQNMDGLEWKRQKYSFLVRFFLKHAERWAVKHADYLIADSIGIQKHIRERFNRHAIYIPYGAIPFSKPDINALKSFGLLPSSYNLLIARMEPENSIDVILEGMVKSKAQTQFLVIGRTDNKYGQYIYNKYAHDKRVRFLGGIFNYQLLNTIRFYARLYFHGHTVGGTNPSLLEAMACQSMIAAHRNIFNSSILDDDAFYFDNAEEVAALLDSDFVGTEYEKSCTENNLQKIREIYSWEIINNKYDHLFSSLTSTVVKSQGATRKAEGRQAEPGMLKRQFT
ncbi:MAG: DUF1972 domain-containing protein [Bacteroidetes bacterium]|nr:DUF1972 domain-containing protein [Bacteroidota bacterium]